MRAWLSAAATLSLVLQGCETAGTEVGNPGVVAARVALMPAGAGWEMRAFHVKLMGLGYSEADGDTGMLFATPLGILRDVAADSGPVSAAPMQSDWKSARLYLAFPKASASPPDTVPWMHFRAPGWAAFRYAYGGMEKKMLFAMPDSLELPLDFDSEALRAGRRGDTLHVTAWFDCRAWMDSLDLADSLSVRQGLDGEYAVLSPGENVAAHARLLRAFAGSFVPGSPP